MQHHIHLFVDPPHHHHPQLTNKDPGLGGAASHPLVRGPLQLSKFRCILEILDWLRCAEPNFPGTILLGYVLWFHGCLGFEEPRPHVFPISPLWCHSRTLMMAPLVLCHWYIEARVRDCRAQLSEKIISKVCIMAFCTGGATPRVLGRQLPLPPPPPPLGPSANS